MIDSVRPLLLRVLRVPGRPATQRERVRVFQASRNFYRYNLLKWAFTQVGAVIGLFVGLAFVRAIPDAVPGSAWIRWGEAVAAAVFLVQLPVTFAMLRLDFQMRWYIVGERSLRIREGLATVREQTMTFANIQNLSIRQGPLQRLLGIADLEVHTAGGGARESPGKPRPGGGQMHVATFRGVDDAEAIRDTLRERVRQYRDAGLGDPDDPVTDSHRPEEPASAASGPAPAAAPVVLAAREVLDAAQSLRQALAAGRVA